jgi:hypothetical protein
MRRFLNGLLSGLLCLALLGGTGCGSNADEKITNPNLKVPDVPPAGSSVKSERPVAPAKKK